MKVIFLDIDGVLNSYKFFATNHEIVKEFYKKNDGSSRITRQILDIDFNKFNMLNDVISQLNLNVVIISSWKKLSIYPKIKEILISKGLPIIGETIDNGNDRGNGIKNYLLMHEVDDYIILDDEIFADYDDMLLSRLVKTSFFDDGLKEEHIDMIKCMLGNENIKKMI